MEKCYQAWRDIEVAIEAQHGVSEAEDRWLDTLFRLWEIYPELDESVRVENRYEMQDYFNTRRKEEEKGIKRLKVEVSGNN